MLHSILYSLQTKLYEKDDTVNRKQGLHENFVIVQSGCLEAVDDFEGNEFVVDRLFMGTVINFRTFMVQETAFLTLKCKEPTKTLEMSYETL